MTDQAQQMLIGVISDTHGKFPPQAKTAFAKADLIIHAGDFDTNEVFAQFRQMGNLIAVRGNMDRQGDPAGLPISEVVQVGEVFIYVIHDILALDLDPQAAGFQVVVHGHLHVPLCLHRQGVLYLNPGSPTSPRRGSKPGAAVLRINGNQVSAELIPFE
ncbi:MAG: metallophosphoesterase [Anaerolineales bacterium]|nr:metallophosphoesterase [Anaerolineales bacterium]